MSSAQWLPLLQYSAKHGVSLSTLRRRIKNNSIAFKLENGKYFLYDGDDEVVESMPAPKVVRKSEMAPAKTAPMSSTSYVESSVLSSANKLVEEIKTAYAKILQEKEDQITQLREEILDLRMLVRILEQQPMATSMSAPRPVGLEESVSISSEDFIFSELPRSLD